MSITPSKQPESSGEALEPLEPLESELFAKTSSGKTLCPPFLLGVAQSPSLHVKHLVSRLSLQGSMLGRCGFYPGADRHVEGPMLRLPL